ncbi:MAG TPA: hypothetical protein VK674_04870 [Candidatus Limnocylindria bacterium]|nr:hypothetical protein [Candidatus Limnocylindria bacterium]
MKLTTQVLQQVYFDNLIAHQIGGETDGMSPEVASDLGFATYEDTLALIQRHEAERDLAVVDTVRAIRTTLPAALPITPEAA